MTMEERLARLEQEKREAIRLAIARERRRCRDRISAEILNFDCYIKQLNPDDASTKAIADEWRIRTECLQSIYQEDDLE